ncbi:unnamed protein product [Meloidogyne enterolobii]|uniref:Uncharacterized protein n=1 Tax=Meloidogyne enterolobii TaxID=390850 RepID=A0ACB0XZ95_MELEN
MSCPVGNLVLNSFYNNPLHILYFQSIQISKLSRLGTVLKGEINQRVLTHIKIKFKKNFLGREIHEIVEQLKKGTKKKKKSGVIHPTAKGSIATADSSTTISDEENDDIEDFEEGIPDILLATTGHGKNSLIKTAAGSMAIAAAISKVIGGEQQNKNNLTTITPIPEEKDEEEGKE